MPVNLTNMDIGTRYALQDDFNNGFVGRDRQVVIQTDDPKGYRPVIMDGKTSGGKSKVALVADLTDYLPKANPAFTGTISGAGGTFTGRVRFNASSIFGYNTDEFKLLEVTGGDVGSNGSVLRLYRNDDPSFSGSFSLSTGNEKYLIGSPSGSLMWNGKEVERVNASGEGYIRYENGLQICWGYVNVPANSKSTEVVLPLPFKDAGHVPIGISIDTTNGHNINVCTATLNQANKFTIMCASTDNGYNWDRGCYWLDVGRWK